MEYVVEVHHLTVIEGKEDGEKQELGRCSPPACAAGDGEPRQMVPLCLRKLLTGAPGELRHQGVCFQFGS